MLTRQVGAVWRSVVADLLALLALIVLPVLFLKALPGGRPPFGGDLVIHLYPLFSLLARALHAGRPELWNSYAAGGYPLAPFSALALYPPVNVALLALPVTGALAALYVFDLALLGVGMYVLAGDLALSRPARLLAAVTMSCCGFVAAHAYAGHLLELGAVAPLPLAFLLLRRAIRHNRPLIAAWCGAVVGLMVLAAGVQFVPFALAPLVALTAWHVGGRLRLRGRRIVHALRPVAMLAVTGAVAAALGAVYLLPFREILPYTLRSAALSYGDASMQSLPWRGLLMFMAPDVFGNAAAGTYWPASRNGPYFHEIYAYAGLVPLLLAPVALLRRHAALPYGLLAIAALAVMLGGNTPLYHLLFSLPGGDQLRAPARAGLVVDFTLALLAGFGLDAFSEQGKRLPLRGLLTGGLIPATTAALVVLVALPVAVALDIVPVAGHATALAATARLGVLLAAALTLIFLVKYWPRLALLIPLLTVLDLVNANGVLLRPVDPASFYRHNAALNMLSPSDARARLLAFDNAIPVGLGMVTGRIYDTQDVAPLALEGYWKVSHPTLVARAHGVYPAGRDTIRDLDQFFLRLFGVRTVFSATPLVSRDLHAAGRITSLRWTQPGGTVWNMYPYTATSFVYHDSAALPRYLVVPRALTIADDRDGDAALGLLRRGVVDPLRVVILAPAGASATGIVAALQDAWTGWLARGSGDNVVAISANGGSAGGYLVVDDGWFPGWVAIVDGRSVPIQQADGLLRALRLPPGRHAVRMVFAPLSYLTGAMVTIATIVVLIAVSAWVWFRHGRTGSRQQGTA